MFKNFSQFNEKAHLLFKDEPFSLILKAFNSFQSLLVALRTEAYDYATWYNKVMRDKYEDGEPVDVTDLPYLSVPRSQLAVIRSRIARVKETVQYAANAITNIALGNKVETPRISSVTTDDVTPTLSGTNSQALLNAIKRIVYAIGDFFVTFGDGSDTITVNGVQLSISPLVRGQFTITKYSTGNNAKAGVIQYRFDIPDNRSLRSTPGEVLRRMCRAPLVVARSRADLACTSQAPIAMLIASLSFFGKKLIIWAESTTERDNISFSGTRYATIFNTDIKAKVVDPSEVKSAIASSLYGYLSEDYVEAMSFDEQTFLLIMSAYTYSGANLEVTTDQAATTTVNHGLIVAPIMQPDESSSIEVATSDVTEATTQTAIADLFFTEQEWSDLESSLAEA